MKTLLFPAIDRLRGEPAAQAEVKLHRGAPRLFLNGQIEYPLLAWSWGLVQSAPLFRQAGLRLLHPILGLNSVWPEPGRYDFSSFDALFDQLLTAHPEAFFLPRVLLDAPPWWLDAYPEECVACALPVGDASNVQYQTHRNSPEGGMQWGNPMRAPSLHSDVWQQDMQRLLRAWVQHIENSPLRSRLFGYQIGGGIYGEWHYFMAQFLPDQSPAAQRKIGPVPAVSARTQTHAGLLRDPAREQDVMAYYRRYHAAVADVLLDLLALVKKETRRRVICGAFYGYHLENVWMQEGGHLAPEKLLCAPDLDFVASPYAYQTTNHPDRPGYQHEVYDEAGNLLGQTRGVGGDGGYRVLLESWRRAGKLYFAEMDAGTFLDPAVPDGSPQDEIEKLLCNVGGVGSDTVVGTLHILRRDWGRQWACGHGGWVFDFGPVLPKGQSWYADDRLVAALRQFVDWGRQRAALDLHPVAQVAALYDAHSYFVTQHWQGEAPYGKGGRFLDFFTRWFMDSQSRALHRLGAPIDLRYRFDLSAEDLRRYRLLYMVNTFQWTDAEIQAFRALLSGSGCTVVWCYAPGFVGPDALDPDRMQRLTGMTFEVLDTPGPFLIDVSLDEADVPAQFGVAAPRWPRFRVVDEDVTVLGHWHDGEGVAFAEKEMDGWRAIYVGTAPLPPALLRVLARRAGVPLWSSRPDLVVATQGTAMVMATEAGPRTLSFPAPLHPLEAYPNKDWEAGEVRLYARGPGGS